ncbi:MAG: Beta-barrel assembly-enhancing protease [Planctomycetes bacterium]|nr:Beta-barrel assembly-enhancing protease [Planctomycetota bacterium]
MPRMRAAPTRRRGSAKVRLVLALVIALFAAGSYLFKGSVNPFTGEKERVGWTVEEEIAIGLQAMPELAAQHGGKDPDAKAQAHVTAVGRKLLDAARAVAAERGGSIPWKFDFHLLRDDRTINAFALPGGQVFITRALYAKFETEGQLAGVLGHEIGHVIERHGGKRMAKAGLLQGLAGAAGVAGGSHDAARAAQQIAGLVQMKYGREDELESDGWGVRLVARAGWDPRAMEGVMRILDAASAGGPPEFLSTHPKPANRVEYVRDLIAAEFPQGLPPGLRP